MDSDSVNDSENSSSNADEETRRVKFLCSFGGSIIPRPQDGKLRYVGGETRIVSVPRDIGVEELMGRMRELYEGAAILKYQQPDEDLDALVSVVNDDDVTNMMEEYDKLGSGEGFTKLRMFLLSLAEQDLGAHYMDGDERDTERRYVDALNSLSESPDYRRLSDSPVMTPVDEFQIADHLYNSINLDGSVHNQRNFDMGLPQYSLRQLAVPTLGSGHNVGSYVPRYAEEGTWSPAHYSPRCAGPLEARPFGEYPSSPSSARYRMPVQEVPESHLHTSSQISFDQQKYSDNVVWLPNGVPVERGGFPGTVERGGFPGNILNGPSGQDGTGTGTGTGTGICGNCRMTFQRNPPPSDFHWKPEEQSHLEQPSVGNAFPQVPNACVNCLPNREAALLSIDSKLQHGICREQGDPHIPHNETLILDREWLMQNQIRMDEPKAHVSGVGRMGEHHPISGTGSNIPLGPSNLPDGNLMPPGYIRHEESRYIRPGTELGGEVFHDHSMVSGSHLYVPLEERGARTSNLPFSCGMEMPHRVLHNNPSTQVPWRNAAAQAHFPPVHDSFDLQPRNSRPGLGVDQSNRVDSPPRKLGVNGSAMPDYPYGHRSNLSPSTPNQDAQQIFPQDPVRDLSNTPNAPPPPLDSRRSSELPTNLYSEISSDTRGYPPVQSENNGNTEVRFDGNNSHREAKGATCLSEPECSNADGVQPAKETGTLKSSLYVGSPCLMTSSGMKPGERASDMIQQGFASTSGGAEKADFSFLPELIASAKRAKLESVEVVKARAQEDGDAIVLQEKSIKDANADETDSREFDCHSDDGSENENIDASKIEVSKAEEEAIAKGLQTIRNVDLEEIRELGTGTYGAVYYGKWKGSDVAIKRIKASCFAGRPSERERLIADFWKEALILSSLHHPNVVSFYGIVRDGPDGSLATVTEFMVNGSLKQYLQKKDRTIDRRKRLIIAMDAAFGMEYLHGKNIVHFDLKCENLLVNMRDPHRPVCKIGDLGLSKVKQNTLVSGGVRGTLPWMAPELLSGKSHMVTEKIDVYSFGIVMWEVLTGEEPYKDLHCASVIGGIVNNTLRPQIPTWCDPEWKSLMESCWAAEPTERPSFADISQKLRSMAAAMNLK